MRSGVIQAGSARGRSCPSHGLGWSRLGVTFQARLNAHEVLQAAKLRWVWTGQVLSDGRFACSKSDEGTGGRRASQSLAGRRILAIMRTPAAK